MVLYYDFKIEDKVVNVLQLKYLNAFCLDMSFSLELFLLIDSNEMHMIVNVNGGLEVFICS